MANDLALFDPKQMQVPAHLRDDDWQSNTTPQQTTPSLLYTGKVWTISVGGEKTKLMKRDSEGDEVPMPVLRVIILDFAPKRGRSYYEGAYDPNATAAPVCWSDDGETPAAAVQDKQAKTCASCKWAVKGSKITEQGKETTACSQHRMLAVVPASKPDMQPLRLKIAVTSDWDRNEELASQNYFAFQQYNNFLNGRGVNHTAKVVTKMRFDPAQAYPKVIFSPDRWITADEAAAVRPRLGSPEVKALLGEAYTPAGADGVPTRDPEAPVMPRSVKPTPKPSALDEDEEEAAPAPAPSAAKPALDDEDEEVAPAPKPKPAARQQRAAPKPQPATATAALDEDEEEAAPAPAPRAAKPAPAAEGKPAVPASVASVLADWGDE